MRFGQFLVDQGLVGPEQVLVALDRQRVRRPLLGMLAQERGSLSMVQTMDILNWQARPSAELRLFGEIAIELGYLGHSQVIVLLEMQRTSAPPLGELLVDMGALGESQLRVALQQAAAVAESHGLRSTQELPAASSSSGAMQAVQPSRKIA